MNLISGQALSEDVSRTQLEKLAELILQTHLGERLSRERVITACDALSQGLDPDKYTDLLVNLGMPKEKARRELVTARHMMSRAYLENRIAIELPPTLETEFTPLGLNRPVRHTWHPLGTLLHIAARNVDALPVFSVIEGLLTGNINILKLPGSDTGLSIPILQQLIHHYPLIADYVFVFDTPSTDLVALQKMAACADAIVVWGGDEAVSAVRNLAQPDTQIIEWGHKISFAYVSGAAIRDADLEGIADNICDTNQTLCNSCQGIYLDTDKFEDAAAFAQRFAKILNRTAASMPLDEDPFLTAQKTLEVYTEELEADATDKHVFREEHCSVIAYSDPALHPSYMYRNCWVKPLPKSKLLSKLLQYKNHLQTVALICEPEEKATLETLLAQTGIVRITTGERMSTSYCGMPHDGRFPLRRYMKIVSYDD